MRCSSSAHVSSFVLAVSILTSLIQVGRVEAFVYPSYCDSINTADWFLEMYADARKIIHSRLNQSTWFLVGWNVSNDHYIQANERYCLGEYMASTIIAYELTSNETYLAEAKWFVDQYLLHEGEGGILYPYTWTLYERTPEANYGWLHHDVMVWWTMQKLNENGCNYNVTGRVDEAIKVAYYNNVTDLGWEYYYWQQTGSAENYVLNAFAPMLFIMSYLTNKNVKDYTADVQRIYHSAEKFRLDNCKYKYKWTDTSHNNEYGLYAIRYYFLGEKYLPDVFNNTKMQQTLEAYTYFDLSEVKTKGRAGAVAVIAEYLGFSLPDTFKRILRLLRDQYYCVQSEFYNFDNIIDYSKYYRIWAHVVMTDLGLSAGINVTFPTISPQVSSGAIYFNTVLRNLTYIYNSPSYVWYPVWSPGYLCSRPQAPISTTFGTAVHFNKTLNAWQRNETWTYDGQILTFHWDKYAKSFNWKATGGVKWRIVDIQNSFDIYPTSLICSNGTITQLSIQNRTWVVTSAFAFEVKYSERRGYWLLFETDNTTLTQFTYRSGVWERMYLWSRMELLNSWRIDETPSLYSSSDWDTVRSYIKESLQRIEQGLCPTRQESIFPKGVGRIIHSDANISNYDDQIMTQNKLLFTLSFHGTSKTYVYCGDKERPTTISGATSWTYYADSKTVTVTVEHLNEQEIVIDWTPPTEIEISDGDYESMPYYCAW